MQPVIVMRMKYDAKAMQNTMQMRCYYGYKGMMHTRCKFNSNTMQSDKAKRCKSSVQIRYKCDTNAIQIRCKYDATGAMQIRSKNTLIIRCKLDANSMQFGLKSAIALTCEIPYKYVANTMQLGDANSIKKYFNYSMQIRCKFDANSMQTRSSLEWNQRLHRLVKHHDAKAMQTRCKHYILRICIEFASNLRIICIVFRDCIVIAS
jgi:hypothetical protein